MPKIVLNTTVEPELYTKVKQAAEKKRHSVYLEVRDALEKVYAEPVVNDVIEPRKVIIKLGRN